MNEEYAAESSAPLHDLHDHGGGTTTDVKPAADDVRARLMGQFEQWLDRMLAGEPAPEGLAEALVEEAQAGQIDPKDDLYSAVSAVTTLAGEVRLQGRAFKQMADGLAPLAETPTQLEALAQAQRQSTRQLESLLDARTSDDGHSDLPPAGEVLSVLFDLRERLDRGLRDFDRSAGAVKSAAPAGWRQRLLGGPKVAQLAAALEALRTGYQFALSRLDAALHQWGIETVGRPGEPFDPSTMNAVDVEQTDDAEDGVVLEVYHSGYAVHGRVFSTARVKVARAKDRAVG